MDYQFYRILDEATYFPPLSEEDRIRLRSISDQCMSMIRKIDPVRAQDIDDFYAAANRQTEKSFWSICSTTKVRSCLYANSKALLSRQRGVRTQNRIHTLVSYYRSDCGETMTVEYSVRGVSWRKAKNLLRKAVELHRESFETKIVFNPPVLLNNSETAVYSQSANWPFKETETGRVSCEEPHFAVVGPKVDNPLVLPHQQVGET
jgi:hypothetical protein